MKLEELAIIAGSALITFALVISFAIVSGCTNQPDVASDYEQSRLAAIEAWEEVIGPVSQKCIDRSKRASVQEAKDIPYSCVPGGPYVGCYLPSDILGNDIIFLSPDRGWVQKARIAVHEYIHLLSFCEHGYIDVLHLDEQLWEEYGSNTVEAIGEGML